MLFSKHAYTSFSFIGRVLYQKRKFELRNIEPLPVNNIIYSENSSDHWKLLFVERMNVLDLGCGRWVLDNLEETSPIYFKNKKANKIVGIDLDLSEVNFFSEYFLSKYSDESIFMVKRIETQKDLADLITIFNINSIKCDIEGAEINFFKLDLNDYPSVKYISIEYHSPVLLKELIDTNNRKWNFKITDHSIFTQSPHMGVVTLSKEA